MVMKVLTYVLLLWWIPAIVIEMIVSIIKAKKELAKVKKESGR